MEDLRNTSGGTVSARPTMRTDHVEYESDVLPLEVCCSLHWLMMFRRVKYFFLNYRSYLNFRHT